MPNIAPDLISIVFVSLLAVGTALQWWLLRRQAKHVRQHADRVPAAFADRISLEDHRKAASYTLAKLGLARWELLFGVPVLLAWTLGGGLALLDHAWLAAGWSPLWQGVALLLSVALVGTLLDLPLRLAAIFGVETRFGFNRTTPARFLADLGLESFLSLLIGIPVITVLLWLMSEAGNLWWLWAWGFWMGFMLLMTWAYPTVIAPIFNKFKPLEQGELRQRLERLLDRCGFRSDGMFVMDGSRRSSHGNAYFTGFGRNKRIVFFDTLLDGLESHEVEAVLAHELGHFRRRHIRKMLMVTATLSLAGLALLGWLSQQPGFYQGLGVQRQSPALALALFMLALPVFSIFLQPLLSAFSRRHEFEADDYAAQQADAGALISGLVKMYRDSASTLTPDPLYSAFHHSHPPAPVRIANLSSKMGHPASRGTASAGPATT
jgi:STE24 endopeptidase